MSGFDDIKVDVLRKAVGKKDAELLESLREDFIEGAIKAGQNKSVVSKLWEDMREFGRYAFNASHAICYAEIGCKTAWLKAHYPSEYMASLISCEPDAEQQSIYIEDARQNGINVLPPDLNRSNKDFSVGTNGDILFGFNQIKGVGSRAVDKILKIKPFDSFGDFLIKAYMEKGINKKVLEALIKCGSCDTFGYKRSNMLSAFEKYIIDLDPQLKRDIDNEHIREHLKKQDLYFVIDDIPEFPMLEILNNEKELLGVNISGNPFDVVSKLVKENGKTAQYYIDQCTKIPNLHGRLLCQVVRMKKIVTKTGKPMAFVDVVDKDGTNISLTCFPNDYAKFGESLAENKYAQVYIRCKVDPKGKSFFLVDFNDLSAKIDEVASKIEAESNLKDIDLHINGLPGTVRLKTLMSKLDSVYQEDSDSTLSVYFDVEEVSFFVKEIPCKPINITLIRDLSRIPNAFISRRK